MSSQRYAPLISPLCALLFLSGACSWVATYSKMCACCAPTEAPTSMLVNGYGGGSCLDGAVLDYEKGDGICTQNREMKALIEAGMSSKQFSPEAKLQDTEGMEEEELFHLLPLKADGHLHHDSSMLNNGSGKGLQRKEAR